MLVLILWGLPDDESIREVILISFISPTLLEAATTIKRSICNRMETATNCIVTKRKLSED